jgi:hypothetical protein
MKLLADVEALLLLISSHESHQARHTAPNKRDIKITTFAQLREIL